MATVTTANASSPAALSPVLGRYFERTWDRGEGHFLWDDQGKRYLDFACGIATTGLGHGHPAVTAAIHAQVDRLVHVSSGLGYIESVNRLSERLAADLPGATRHRLPGQLRRRSDRGGHEAGPPGQRPARRTSRSATGSTGAPTARPA